MASYTISYTSTSVTFVVSGFNIGEYLRFFVRPEPATGEMIVNAVTVAPSVEPYTTTFGGLSPNTSYATNVYVSANNDNGVFTDYVVLGTQYFVTKQGVEKWSWSKSNGNASAAQTQTAYAAITGKGKITDFSYLVWNDMVDKAVELQASSGISWSSSYATAASTKMTSSDKEMTAARFNSLRQNIDLGCSTGLSAVSKGNIIYGSYFTKLTDAMNSWS